MMIKEGNISFEFSGDAIKYDDTFFYRKHIEKCKGIVKCEKDKKECEVGTKAVDILGLDKNPLFMIEIKDFRQHRIENKERIKNTELATEFSLKVRDTLAGLYGAFRNHNEELKIFYSHLFHKKDQPNSIKAILLLEEDLIKNSFEEKSRKSRKKELRTKIEQQLGFLSLQAHVVSISEINQIQGWKVK